MKLLNSKLLNSQLSKLPTLQTKRLTIIKIITHHNSFKKSPPFLKGENYSEAGVPG
jgi:hypothetical protein